MEAIISLMVALLAISYAGVNGAVVPIKAPAIRLDDDSFAVEIPHRQLDNGEDEEIWTEDEILLPVQVDFDSFVKKLDEQFVSIETQLKALQLKVHEALPNAL